MVGGGGGADVVLAFFSLSFTLHNMLKFEFPTKPIQTELSSENYC